MPAIRPADLIKQASELAENFSQPALFVRSLHTLLESYTDHTHRSGQSGEPFPLIGAYNTPPPVMRQVWVELAPQLKLHPECLLPLCDALWAESNYDLRLLAARLLGQAAIDPPGPVLQRLQAWVHPDLDRRLLDGLLQYGLEQFRNANPSIVIQLASDWLASPVLGTQQAGLRAILPLVKHSGPENLPAIFKLLTPYLRLAPTRLRPDILSLLAAIIQASPAETAYVLRYNLSAPNNPDAAWLIRQVLSAFPEDLQKGLKVALKSMAASASNPLLPHD
jgi:hypothetical protein